MKEFESHIAKAYFRNNFITETHRCGKCAENRERKFRVHRILNKTADQTYMICLGCNGKKTVMSQNWVKENLGL
jgi:hypothetical protein|tara:strand:- start:194 stop:415 length:222 start_codon:yes stop_codon:yes gene_type:complete